jgi:Phosphotransferase enzyme family
MLANNFDCRIPTLISIHQPDASPYLVIVHGNAPIERHNVKYKNIAWADDPSHLFNQEQIYSDKEFIILFSDSNNFKDTVLGKLREIGFHRVDGRIIFPSLNNPRWVFPERGSYLLKVGRLVKPSRLIAKVAWAIMRVLYCLRLHRLVFPSEISVFAKDRNANYIGSLPIFKTISKAIGSDQFDFVLYTGVAGELMKFTAQVMDQFGDKWAFVKMGFSTGAALQIENEKKCLLQLNEHSFQEFNFPNLISEGKDLGFAKNYLIQSPAPPTFKSWTKKLNMNHVSALAELFNKTVCEKTSIYSRFENLFSNFKTLSCQGERLNLVASVCDSILCSIDVYSEIEVSLGGSHGDFIPWNVLFSKKSIFVFDWENYKNRLPAWDLLNYIFHVEIMVHRADIDQITSRLVLQEKKYFRQIQEYFCLIDIDFSMYKICLLNYLLEILFYYLDYEAKQLKNRQPLHLAPEFVEKSFHVYKRVLAHEFSGTDWKIR